MKCNTLSNLLLLVLLCQGILNIRTQCVDTQDGCRSCSSSTQCDFCGGDYYLDGAGCSSCAPNYFAPARSDDITDCQTCLDSKPNCETCASASNCESCKENFVLFFDGSCMPCDPNYFATAGTDIFTGCTTCTDSDPYCDTCASASTCSSCKENSFLFIGDHCTECDPNSFAPAGSIGPDSCQTCSELIPGCETCSDASTCSSCQDDYNLSGDGTECLEPGTEPVTEPENEPGTEPDQTESSQTESKQSNIHIGGIIGGVLGGVCLLMIAVVILVKKGILGKKGASSPQSAKYNPTQSEATSPELQTANV